MKIFALPVPSELQAITTPLIAPIELTSSKAASALQPLPGGRLLFIQSSFTSPNNIYVLQGLEVFEADFYKKSGPFQGRPHQLEITHFAEDALIGKALDSGEEFWFKGASNRYVQGWIFKPNDWTAGDIKKWSPLLFIHGGS